LNQKKQEISNLEQQIDLLKLSPEQLEIIENYNRTVNNENIEFLEWISKKTTIYDMIATIIISVIFFWLGRKSIKKTAANK
jgi:hypothetical protein